MSCDRARSLFYDLTDADISRDDAVWLALHLAGCRPCADELSHVRRADAFLAARLAVSPPAELDRRIVDSVWRTRGARGSDGAWIGIAAAVAAACTAAALLSGQGLQAVSEALSQTGVGRSGGIPAFRFGDVSELWNALAQGLARLGTTLPSAALPNSWGVLAAVISLQIAGSIWLLSAKRLGSRAGNGR